MAELSDPKPVSFHPDQEELDDLTAAKVCSFTYEEGSGEEERQGSKLRSRRRIERLDEDDPKYAGRAISRKDFYAEYNGELFN